jgi:hypothetical protein
MKNSILTIIFLFLIFFTSKVFAIPLPITDLSAKIGDYENEINLDWTYPNPYYWSYCFEIQKSTNNNIIWSTGTPGNIIFNPPIPLQMPFVKDHVYYTMASLNVSATYYFHIWVSTSAYTQHIWSSISNETSAWTEIHNDATPPNAINDLTVTYFPPPMLCDLSSKKPSGIYYGWGGNLSFTATGDDGIIGKAHHYQVRITTNPYYDWQNKWNEAEVVSYNYSPNYGYQIAPPGEQEEINITRLYFNCTNYIAIKVSDEYNNYSAVSNIVECFAYTSGGWNPLIKTWPNPYKVGIDSVHITGSIPINTTCKIYSLSGKLVKTLSENSGEIDWDGKNERGNYVMPGLYIYVLKDNNGNKKIGKIAAMK